MKLIYSTCLLFLVVISCENNGVNSTNDIVATSISLDSIRGSDTISSYSIDSLQIFISYTKSPQMSIGLETTLDTSNIDTVKFILRFLKYSKSNINEGIQVDSLPFRPFNHDTLLKKYLNKHLTICDSSFRVQKTIFLSDSLSTRLPILTDSNITQTITNSHEMIVLYIESRFCPPCVIFRPIFEDFANHYRDSGVACYCVIASKTSNYLTKNNIRSVPAYVFVDSLAVVDVIVGGQYLDKLQTTISEIRKSKIK